MFLLISDDLFMKNKIINLLIDSDIIFTDKKDQRYFCKIDLSYSNNALKFSINNDLEIFNCPVEFKIIYDSLISQLKKYSIKLSDFNYYPLSGVIKQDDKLIKLNFIHNSIFNSLLLFREGVNKIELYKKIWPKDVNISLNKLDTHLTNLKNILSSQFNCNITFQSISGIQKLVVN